jgi:hypothetical protein
LYEKSTLDSLVGDEQSAAQNLGEAFGGAVTVVVGGLGGKTFTKLNGKTDIDVKVIKVNRKKYPESANHIDEAQNNGHPRILTVNRKNAQNNRKKSLKGIPTKKGQDRDEYPPAMFKEGGEGASVRHIKSSDNRGSGSCIGAQCRDVKNGEKIILKVIE